MIYDDVTFVCPKCGAHMNVDEEAVIELECPLCGATGTIGVTSDGQYYPEVSEEYSILEILENPEENMPDCCRACGCGAYPDCISCCSIFDD